MHALDKQGLIRTADRFSVVVAYEDTVTRDLAIRLCEHSLAEFRGENDLNFSWLKFEVLRESDVAELATNVALHSDMVIVSAHAGMDLPNQVKSWIESWAAKKTVHPAALVDLVGVADVPAVPEPTPVHFYLQNVARQAHMHYFSPETVSDSHRQIAQVPVDKEPGETRARGDMAVTPYTPAPSHWGINE